MALRYWLYSGLAFLGALLLLFGGWWLDRATEPRVDLKAVAPALGFTPQANYTPVAESRQDVDTILAIDFSGSMSVGERATDPTNLRLGAADLLISSLASDVFPRASRMAYLSFGNQADVWQPLIAVEDSLVRQELAAKLNLPGYDDHTNIEAALQRSHELLFPQGARTSSNIPSVILLTDGDPRGGGPNNNRAGITQVVQRLTEQGTILFVIILRNPNVPQEATSLQEWRVIWKELAETNGRVRYMEAQSAADLENIYDVIRSRLVNEGTKPGGRYTYDPRDVNAAITMPPNLLQAHLLVSRTGADQEIELVAPDGTLFNALQQQDARNERLDTPLYYRFRIYRPQSGRWTLRTTAIDPLYYRLNPESLYSPRVAWQEGTPYLHTDKDSPLSFIVVDDQGRPTSLPFNLNAAILRTVLRPEGTIVEESIPLPPPVRQPDGYLYQTIVSAQFVSTMPLSTTIEVTGQADDGTLVNVSLTELPATRAPTGVTLEVPTGVVECDQETLVPWPPTIRCGNLVTAVLEVQGAEMLSPGSLTGTLYPFPPATASIPMSVTTPSSLSQQVGPLLTAGTYEIVADAHSKLIAVDAYGKPIPELHWRERGEAQVEVVWPSWVKKWDGQFTLGAILLGICSLWKPLLVPLLLPLFARLRLAPMGFYSESGTGAVDDLYRIARRRHKLFTLTVGRYGNRATDIPTSEDCVEKKEGAPSRGALPGWLANWLCREPLGRVVATPFIGTHAEATDGWRELPERPGPISFGKTRFLMAQKDWTDRL